MKEPFEEPKMTTETVDIDLVMSPGSSPITGPVDQLQPFFGLCCN